MEAIIGAGAPRGNSAAAAADLIKNSSAASFMTDVVDGSREVPVIVDFWAPWCGPCKQLGPMLEKAVREAKGTVRMVKVNIDENQELAAQMRIQSIPAVYAFFQGRPVDGFVGALPESQIKAFIQRLTQLGGGEAGPSPIEEALEAAKQALAENDLGAASAIYGQVLAHEPGNLAATAGLARAHLQAGDAARARQLLDGVPKDKVDAPEIASVRSALELAEQAGKAAAELGPLMERLARDPNDHQARFDLAMAHYGAGDSRQAIDELLEIVRRNREWNEQAARKQLLKLFEAIGPTDELVVAARRRLSSILFS
ncbi:MAG TPA: thioredoxin [Alphaproteobacteria bacterium]|nr:thioredoxin [Alphaproteobacteria bacterium]